MGRVLCNTSLDKCDSFKSYNKLPLLCCITVYQIVSVFFFILAAICQPGSFSKDGLSPCTKCPKSFYFTQNASTTCQECDSHRVTLQEGSLSSTDCKSLAQVNNLTGKNNNHEYKGSFIKSFIIMDRNKIALCLSINVKWLNM